MSRIPGGRWWLVVSVLLLAACSRSAPPAATVTVPQTPPTTSNAPIEVVSAVPVAPRPPGPIEVLPDDAVWGAAEAPVEIVYFTDLQCPFCKRVEPTLEQLRSHYGPERLRIVFKNNPLPFHRNAMPAARAARAVLELRGSEAFFAFVRRAFEQQMDLSRDNLLAWAAEVKAAPDQVAARMDAPATAERLGKDMALAKTLGALGTPAFFINGVRLPGAQPLDKFQEIIDAELAKTDELLEAGTARNQVAVVRTNANFVAPAPEPSRVEQGEPDDETVWLVPVGKSPVLGPADALVTLVVFDDLQCPFCKRAHGTVKELVKQYGPDLRVVYKHNPLPFHARALPAALLATEARAQKGDAAFFKVVDLAFESQDNLETDGLRAIAKAAGLDVAAAMRAVESGKHKAVIEEEQQLAADVNARGTPHFFVNGRRLSGAQPLETFKAIIDRALASAGARVAAGVPRSGVYADLMKTAKPPPEPERKEVKAPSSRRPSRGPKNAPVVITMFSDLECPFCRRVMPTIDALLQKYPTQVRVVYRHLPLEFHRGAQMAAEASLEAFAQKGDAAFWAFLPLVHGSAEVEGPLTQDELSGYAAKVGADPQRFRTALEKGTHKAAVDEDRRAATAAGINGTPGFTVNGYFLSGAQPLQAFERLVRRALDEAAKPGAKAAR